MLSENLNSGSVCKNIEETGQMNGWAFVDQREKLSDKVQTSQLRNLTGLVVLSKIKFAACILN